MSKSCASWSKPSAFKVAVCIQERHGFRRLYQIGEAAIAFRSKEEKIGVRSHCGPFVKTSSLKGDSTLQQAKLQLAQVWCRPVEALDFFAADGSPLDTEERWEGLVRGTDSIEVNLVLDRGRLLGRKGSKAGAKPKAKLTAKRSLAGLAASSSPWRN